MGSEELQLERGRTPRAAEGAMQNSKRGEVLTTMKTRQMIPVDNRNDRRHKKQKVVVVVG